MSQAALTALSSSKQNKWMWQSNPNPFVQNEPAEWTHYSDVVNIIIEEAFLKGQPGAMLDEYYINFQHKVQIYHFDDKKQRPVKRMGFNRDDKRSREERFTFDPIAPRRPFGGEYGWISPFVVNTRQYLGLGDDQLPSTNRNLIPMLVEKAACGIIEEGKQIGKRCEAEKLAELLREQKGEDMEMVWKRCAYLYSLDSFLYRKLNEVMRLIGGEEHEQIWRSKVHTLGPFCLLLWDDPMNKRTKGNLTLYRGCNLTDSQLATYEDLAKHPDEYRSFQAFTSCSRDANVANGFSGKVLFIMKVSSAFTSDLSQSSEFPGEKEELISPSACFNVQRMEFNNEAKKYFIYLTVKHRFSESDQNQLSGTPKLTPSDLRRRYPTSDYCYDALNDPDYCRLFPDIRDVLGLHSRCDRNGYYH